MNKRIKNVIALLLAVVTSAILPLSAFAIVYSGGYGGVNYVLNYSGSRTNIPCTLSVDTDSFLYLKTKAYIATNDGEWGYVEQTVNPGKKTSYVSSSYTYSSLSGVPTGGHFSSCNYTARMNGYYLLNGDSLSF